MNNSSQLNDRPLVSILVPVYNVGKYLTRCLESILNQTYNNIELIIVNDASTDDSLEIISNIVASIKTDKIIKVISHDYNIGIGGTRLTGLREAKGEWIMFVDGDDYLEDNAVKKLVDHVSSNPTDLVIFGYFIEYKNKKIRIRNDYQDKPKYLEGLLLKNKCVSFWNKFYKRSLFKDYGILPEEGLNQGDDYAVTPRIAYVAKNISCLDDYLYTYIKYNIHSYTRNFQEWHITQLKRADDILVVFFNNIVANETLDLMRIRTILYMYKIATYSSMKRIKQVYGFSHLRGDGLSRQDKLLIWLINNRMLFCIPLINHLRNFYFKFL